MTTKTQLVLLRVTVPDDASDPDVLISDVLDAQFIDAGEDYRFEMLQTDTITRSES